MSQSVFQLLHGGTRQLLPALLVLCASSISFSASAAEDKEYSREYAVCLEKSGGVTVAMIECIGAENQRQDKRLNTAYKAVMAEQTPARKKELQAAQRLWIQFRDANCGFYFDPDGGSMARVAANECVLTMTQQRAQELESLRAQQ